MDIVNRVTPVGKMAPVRSVILNYSLIPLLMPKGLVQHVEGHRTQENWRKVILLLIKDMWFHKINFSCSNTVAIPM